MVWIESELNHFPAEVLRLGLMFFLTSDHPTRGQCSACVCAEALSLPSDGRLGPSDVWTVLGFHLYRGSVLIVRRVVGPSDALRQTVLRSTSDRPTLLWLCSPVVFPFGLCRPVQCRTVRRQPSDRPTLITGPSDVFCPDKLNLYEHLFVWAFSWSLSRVRS